MIVLVRHPAVEVPPGIVYGRTDVPLAPGADLAGIVRHLPALSAFTLWSSPARRCTAVAGAIAAAHGVAWRNDARLLELDFGAWEGAPWSGVPRADLDRWAASPTDFAPPDGESGASLIARVTAFHRELRHCPGPHVVVSHGGPLRLLAALAAGRAIDLLAPSPPLGSVQVFQASPPDAPSGEGGGAEAQHGAFGDHA